ncbi:hypothetical protein NJ76_21640 [Rhodococcus sp. IITR03]|nr:hypothetical protein NJ76_21640 [Rhodococcus sp. IITR03]
MAIETAQFTVDRPGRFMGVGIEVADDASVSVTQSVGSHLFDHRGQTTLASIGVFTDVAAGAPAGIARFAETGERPQGVLSHVTATLAHPFPVSGTSSVTGSSLFFDESTAVSGTDVRDEEGVLVAHLVGRSIVVGRARWTTAPRRRRPCRSGASRNCGRMPRSWPNCPASTSSRASPPGHFRGARSPVCSDSR